MALTKIRDANNELDATQVIEDHAGEIYYCESTNIFTKTLSYVGIITPDDCLIASGVRIDDEQSADDDLLAITKLEHATDIKALNITFTQHRCDLLLKCTRCEQLDLTGSTLSDTMVHDLLLLPAIKSVRLRATNITNHTIQKISSATKIVDMDLSFTAVGDSAIEELMHTTKLTSINLTDTQIGDNALLAMAKSQQLQNITVNGTRISDAGLLAFAARPPKNVVRLSILRTNTSIAAIAEAKRKMNSTVILAFPDDVLPED